MAKKHEVQIEYNSVVLDTVLEEVMHNAMIPYAEDVILDRAIPRVEDGLKPVQRRVLYSMHEMGLTPDKPHKKCAKIVGDCLGKYHPHGDSSVYGALVIMAQPFSMRMPLIDGHGNFGSIDGDGAAAYRYTEARMSALTLELLRDLDKDTVQWTANFDDTMEEPNTLPGRFPNLLVNGAYGIAIGLATNIPTHNMGECIDACCAQIDNPAITTKELLQIMKGPDFPSGGYVIPVDSLESIYDAGRGKIKIRSKVHIEKEDNGKKNIVITEIPYDVNKAKLLRAIADLKEKEKETLAGIVDVVDESDKTGVRGVIKLKKDADAKKILDYLMKKTDLEISYSYNMVAIANGKPEILSLKNYLTYYIEYQRQVVLNRSLFDLKAAEARAEIVSGLLIAIRDIDAVIKIIKESESTQKAKEKLKETFDLTDPQAQAILDMQLKKIAKLEVGKLEEELANLKKTIAKLKAIVESKKKQLNVVKDEMQQIKNAMPSQRKTVILTDENGEALDASRIPTAKEEAPYKDGVVTLNNDGQLRFMSQRAYSLAQKDMSTLDSDSLPVQALSCNNKGSLFAFTNLGNLIKLDVTNLPEKKFKEKPFKAGAVCPDIVTGEYVVKLVFFDGTPVGEFVLYTEQGNAKRVDINEFTSTNKAYLQAIVIDNGDKLINAEPVSDELYTVEITKDGQVLAYSTLEVPLQGRRAAGVKGIKLNDGDSVVFAGQVQEEGELIVMSTEGCIKKVITSTIELTSRYLKGVKIIELDKAKVQYVSSVTDPYDLAYVTNGKTEVINTEDIRIETRTTKGKPLAKGKIEIIVPVNKEN